MVCIVGCCHPKARSEGYVGPQLTWKRMAGSWKSLRGRPLLDNHNKRRRVGQVLDAWVDGEKQLWIRAEVDESTTMGREVAQLIRTGQYKGLSLGMDHGVVSSTASAGPAAAAQDRDEWSDVHEVLWSDITEVSVCPRGKYPNTVLHTHFSEDPDTGSEESPPPPAFSLVLATPLSQKTNHAENTGRRGHNPQGRVPSTSKRSPSTINTTTPTGLDSFTFTGFGHLLSTSHYPNPTPTTMSDQTAATPAVGTTTTTAPPTTTAAATPATIPAVGTPAAAPAVATQGQTEAAVPATDGQKPVPTGKDAAAAAQKAKGDAAKGGEAATDATKTDSTAHQLALAQLEVQKMRQEMAATQAEFKKMATANKGLTHTVGVYRNATQSLLKTGDAAEVAKLAEERRSKMVQATHVQAQELLPTLQEWVGAADAESKDDMATLARNIHGFVGASEDIIKNKQLLDTTIGTTRVLHTIKAHGDRLVAAEKAKTAEAQKFLTEAQTALQGERAQRAAVEKELTVLRRRIELLDQAGVSGGPATGGLGNSMGFDQVTHRTTLQSMASTTPATQAPAAAATANSVIGSLLGGSTGSAARRNVGRLAAATPAAASPGEKRTFAQTQVGVKKSVASATPATPAKRARFTPMYDPKLPIGGCIGVSTRSSRLSESLQEFSMGIGDRYKSEGGSNIGLLSGVTLEGSLENETTLPPGWRRPQQMGRF